MVLNNSGFSYVYLVTDSGGSLYALKKIRCPFGQESVRNALKEVEAYNLFNHKSIIKCIVRTSLSSSSFSLSFFAFVTNLLLLIALLLLPVTQLLLLPSCRTPLFSPNPLFH